MNNEMLILALRLSEIYQHIHDDPKTARHYSTELIEIKCHPQYESHILPEAIDISKKKVDKW